VNLKLIIIILAALLLSGCLAHRMGMYLSPLDSQTNPYHTMPFHSDSLKTAIYASILYSAGAANDKGWDWVHAGQANIYRAHNLGNFQAYYGLNFSVGNYHVSEFYNSHYKNNGGFIIGDVPIDTFYHIPSNTYYFGSYGLSAGINGVKSQGHREWRYLGVEITMQKEFGDYYPFRQKLVDSAANMIFKNNLTGTIGIYTDALWSNRYHTQYGLKFALNMLVNSRNDYTIQNSYSIFPITYFSMTFHTTVKQFSGFMQGNFGTKAASFQIGTSFRFGK
jgi:hypothetical protein